MRIAVNASIVDPTLSGLGVYTVNLLRELARLHDDLVVYVSCPEDGAVSAAQVRKISTRVQPARGRTGHLQRVVWTQTILPWRVLADRVALLLSPVPEGMLLPVVPQVVVVHDLIPLHFPESLPRQHLYFRYFVPLLVRASRAVVAVSENTKQDLVAFYGLDPSKIRVVPNGVDPDRYRWGIDPGAVKRKYGLEEYVLYVGNILPHKNLRGLLDAFALIMGQVPHTLVIAGRRDPRYHPGLAARAERLGLERRVSFLDYVPQDELPALYAGATVFVLPSLYEGFGLPVLEAMGCGTPVIASRAGSLPEVAGDAAMLVDPRDVRGLADAIAAVVRDPEVGARMRRNGLHRARRFGWDRTAAEMLGCLRDAIGLGAVGSGSVG